MTVADPNDNDSQEQPSARPRPIEAAAATPRSGAAGSPDPDEVETAIEAHTVSVPEREAGRESDADELGPEPEPVLVPAPAASGAKAPPMRWYVVQVYSGYEQKVKLSLVERIRQAGRESDFGEILIPTETVQDPTRGKRVSSKTFYPGYIFVQMSLSDEAWVEDKDGNLVFLAQSDWMLKVAKEDYPELTFHFNSEFKTKKAEVA
jgi:hypothetical protein